MTLSQFETIVKNTPRGLFVVEWAFSVRSMYLLSGLEPYNHLATILSDLLESYPSIARLPVGRTNIFDAIARRLLTTVD